MDADKAKLVIDVEQSKYGGAGVVSSYLLKHIAAAAGSFAPGIQDRLFFDLQRRGGDVQRVQAWLAENLDKLAHLGYSFFARNVALRTAELGAWVREGKGYRGAIIPAQGSKFHPDLQVDDSTYTVALCCRDNELVMIDPWPGTTPRQIPPPANLDAARLAHNFLAVAVYWRGYS